MKPRLAVVEDNPDNRMLVEAILEDDFEIVEFETGTEAVEGLVDANPDVVLLDISLPGMDGTEVLTWLRTESSIASVPVIALTAHAMAGDRERYIQAGFDDYVSKPIVDEAVLTGAIRRCLGSQP